MSDVKWIKVCSDIFNNRKIKQIEMLPDADMLIVIWFKILCLAGTVNDMGFILFTQDIPYTDEMLSREFNRPLNTVRLALQTFEKFNMLEIVDNIYRVSNWEKYQNIDGMEKIREQTRLRVEKHRENQRQKYIDTIDNCVTLHVTQCNATEQEQEQDIYIVQKNAQNESVFEKAWKLYPEKKGKSAVSKKSIALIEKLGFEEMSKRIDRYKKSKQDWQQWMNGSTFFNGRHEDYADAVEEEKKEVKPFVPVYEKIDMFGSNK